MGPRRRLWSCGLSWVWVGGGVWSLWRDVGKGGSEGGGQLEAGRGRGGAGCGGGGAAPPEDTTPIA